MLASVSSTTARPNTSILVTFVDVCVTPAEVNSEHGEKFVLVTLFRVGFFIHSLPYGS